MCFIKCVLIASIQLLPTSVPFFSLEFILSFCEVTEFTDYCICVYLYRTRWCIHSCIIDSFTEVMSLEIIDSPTTIINCQYPYNCMCDVLCIFFSQAEFLYFVQVLWMLFKPLWTFVLSYSSSIIHQILFFCRCPIFHTSEWSSKTKYLVLEKIGNVHCNTNCYTLTSLYKSVFYIPIFVTHRSGHHLAGF